jgi:hypothetical protein
MDEPWAIPLFRLYKDECCPSTTTSNLRLIRKLCMKYKMLPLTPQSSKIEVIRYLQVILYAFCISKLTSPMYCLHAIVSHISVSMFTRQS